MGKNQRRVRADHDSRDRRYDKRGRRHRKSRYPFLSLSLEVLTKDTTQKAFEITFKSSHPHDTAHALTLAREIFSGEHKMFTGPSPGCECKDNDCDSRGCVGGPDGEVVTIGAHIVVSV